MCGCERRGQRQALFSDRCGSNAHDCRARPKGRSAKRRYTGHVTLNGRSTVDQFRLGSRARRIAEAESGTNTSCSRFLGLDIRELR
jgi:hypothetical protein